MLTVNAPPKAPQSGLASAAASLTTPTAIWAGLGAVAVATVLLFVALSAGIGDARNGTKAIGSDTVPSINAALDLYSGMSNLDADLANYLMLAKTPSKDLTQAQVKADYETNLVHIGDRLVAAGQNITLGDAERVPILTMTVGLAHFTVLVGRAELLSDQHDDKGAVDAMREATALMHDPDRGLLAAATKLADANHKSLTDSYEDARSGVGAATMKIALAGLILLAMLVAFQVMLSIRTARTLNLALVGATVLTAVVMLAGIGVMSAENTNFKVAKEDAYDSVYSLSLAKALASDANADESRFIVDPERSSQYERAFLDKSVALVNFEKPVDINSYDAAMGRALDQLRTAVPPMTGSLGVGLHNITFGGELDAAKATARTWGTYQTDDRKLRTLAASRDLTEAVRFNTSPKAGDSNGDFAAFSSALDHWTQVNQTAFDASIDAAGSATTGWSVIPGILALAVLALTFFGIRPRLADFR